VAENDRAKRGRDNQQGVTHLRRDRVEASVSAAAEPLNEHDVDALHDLCE
jgi:hypothetical protein